MVLLKDTQCLKSSKELAALTLLQLHENPASIKALQHISLEEGCSQCAVVQDYSFELLMDAGPLLNTLEPFFGFFPFHLCDVQLQGLVCALASFFFYLKAFRLSCSD